MIFLIGDFTALIGDPSGRNTTRPPLSRDRSRETRRTISIRRALVLRRDKTEIRYTPSGRNRWVAAGR